MATYTGSNRLVKPATNEFRNTWGTELNGGLIDGVDASMDGSTNLALTADVTLTTANGAPDQARSRKIKITSSDQHDRVITIPAVEKWYIIKNDSAYRVRVKTASGVAVTIPAYCSPIITCDGTDCAKMVQSDYGLISTTNTGIGSSFVLTLTGYDCKDFYLVFNGVKSVVGASTLVNAAFSSDNSTYTAAARISDTVSHPIPCYGAMRLDMTTRATGMVSFAVEPNTGSFGDNTVDTVHSTGTSQIWAWRLSGGIKYVRISITGSTFDGTGTVEVWGK